MGLKCKPDFMMTLDGDEIIIFAINDSRDNYIDLKGPVKRPGRYELIPSLSLKD